MAPHDFASKTTCGPISYLEGNTIWPSGDHGPSGLHKTPSKWCRYCGSRVAKSWRYNARLCGKCTLFLFRDHKDSVAICEMFKDGDVQNGRELTQL